ncbi:hypothetical protein DLAC_06562 [Tieghemostelium lacteum]|uniref:WW domain-containing protein n=1 Tax=Tieghemostelium lacteum TaxID=361077 RepID=A0A151ZF32_TIELA|nr:hypothetical protein DLAC_06562 [Tieghemostelium lacteum]|eukprot:KYQ92573.1 hypothetical protein DLAC_06562 [Tieghemostelium lacteum]
MTFPNYIIAQIIKYLNYYNNVENEYYMNNAKLINEMLTLVCKSWKKEILPKVRDIHVSSDWFCKQYVMDSLKVLNQKSGIKLDLNTKNVLSSQWSDMIVKYTISQQSTPFYITTVLVSLQHLILELNYDQMKYYTRILRDNINKLPRLTTLALKFSISGLIKSGEIEMLEMFETVSQCKLNFLKIEDLSLQSSFLVLKDLNNLLKCKHLTRLVLIYTNISTKSIIDLLDRHQSLLELNMDNVNLGAEKMMLEGWKENRLPDGSPSYYYNTITKKTSWEFPGEEYDRYDTLLLAIGRNSTLQKVKIIKATFKLNSLVTCINVNVNLKHFYISMGKLVIEDEPSIPINNQVLEELHVVGLGVGIYSLWNKGPSSLRYITAVSSSLLQSLSLYHGSTLKKVKFKAMNVSAVDIMECIKLNLPMLESIHLPNLDLMDKVIDSLMSNSHLKKIKFDMPIESQILYKLIKLKHQSIKSIVTNSAVYQCDLTTLVDCIADNNTIEKISLTNGYYNTNNPEILIKLLNQKNLKYINIPMITLKLSPLIISNLIQVVSQNIDHLYSLYFCQEFTDTVLSKFIILSK